MRFVAPRSQVKPISDFFGDSYRSLSEINWISLGVGIALGLLVGMIPITLARRHPVQARRSWRPADRRARPQRPAPHRSHRVEPALQRQPDAAPIRLDSSCWQASVFVPAIPFCPRCKMPVGLQILLAGASCVVGDRLPGAVYRLQAAQDSLWPGDWHDGSRAHAACRAGLRRRSRPRTTCPITATPWPSRWPPSPKS